MDFYGNRHSETYTYKRVAFSNWQEHEAYGYITNGDVEYNVDSELKVTGSFDFEGYEKPVISDLIRIYYSFTDDEGLKFNEPIATLFVSYASLNLVDTVNGIKSTGTLDGTSVLKALQEKVIPLPMTISKNDNPVYYAQDLVKSCGLQVNAEPTSYVMGKSYTFEAGSTYLEIVNELMSFANYKEAFPDAMGVVQLISTIDADEVVFRNDDKSIMYPEVAEDNDWQETPNIVYLLYNTTDACISAYAKNMSGGRSSLDVRGREICYFEEVSDIGTGNQRQAMYDLAVSYLQNKSSDIEYVTISHAYVPMMIYNPITIDYGDLEWTGQIDTFKVTLSPSTKTETRLKKVLTQNVEIEAGSEVIR